MNNDDTPIPQQLIGNGEEVNMNSLIQNDEYLVPNASSQPSQGEADNFLRRVN